jgi:hypothetical protein
MMRMFVKAELEVLGSPVLASSSNENHLALNEGERYERVTMSWSNES